MSQSTSASFGLQLYTHKKSYCINLCFSPSPHRWVPFKVMFPDSSPLDVPVILISTYFGSDLSLQIRLGKAVSALRFVLHHPFMVKYLPLLTLPLPIPSTDPKVTSSSAQG